MLNELKVFILSLIVFFMALPFYANPAKVITGTVHDAKTKEPLIGATVLVKEFSTGAAADVDGNFTIPGISGAKCTMVISCLSYKTLEIEHNLKENKTLNILLESTDVQLNEVVVKAQMTTNTETSLISTQKALPQVTSGISAAQISKSPDRVASEVVKRISGVTVIDDRYIIVRGLSQRYNNAWINGLAVPSTEIDSRAFPLDLLPSSQIDNLLIYKSPSPEIPGDFSGGFVKITSKSVPDENSIEIGYTTGFNVNTQFSKFRYNPGSNTDFLGLGTSKRSLSDDFPTYINPGKTTSDEISSLTKTGFNNDWRIKTRTPLPDQRLSFVIARKIREKIGNITAITYSNTFKTIEKMKNARYGIYSSSADMPVIFDNYFDNQFSNDVRLGFLHNWAFIFSSSNCIEFKNLVNILGKNRLTERTGIRDVSSMYYREQTEIQYTSRLTYSGQISGTHHLSRGNRGNRGSRGNGGNRNSPTSPAYPISPISPISPTSISCGTLTWDVGYSFANRHEPDRRIISNLAGIRSEEDIPSVVTTNENIKRYFQQLEDNAFSGAVNYKYTFNSPISPTSPISPISPTLKTGIYGEYRMRNFNNREFIYDPRNLPYDERQVYLRLPFEQMMDEQYLGADKVYIEEITQKTNNYSAKVGHLAGYVALEIPINKFSIYAGARLENNNTILTRDNSMTYFFEKIEHKHINELNILPSINLTYKISKKHQIRSAYGMSVNRPELREISPSVYFDFDLFSEIGGNPELKTAIINNVDLRYEFYPNYGEIISLGVFYKHFKNPIEWTFIDMGGSLRYMYENADKAESYGVEIEMRKKLDFIKLPSFTLVVNAALIKSNVHFNPGEVLVEPDRPMQGQSPYIINAGIYYHSKKGDWDVALLYNRIGKRIVGLGKSSSSDGNINNIIPDSYEMPRNVLDLTISKAIGKHIELRFSIKDIISENIIFKQFPKFEKEGIIYNREQITRQYNPGQSVSFGVNVKL